jgi:formyl-CoA transferase
MSHLGEGSMSANVSDFTFLQGVKIVDFTQFEAGPSCTEALAWMGADVVKIENPRMGDPGRRLRQPDDDPYYFHAFAPTKVDHGRLVTQGLELVKAWSGADVMIENFRPAPSSGYLSYTS